jgi:phosphonate transport system substrate-binding protein
MRGTPLLALASLLLLWGCRMPAPLQQRSQSADGSQQTAQPSVCVGDQAQARQPRSVAIVPQLPPAELYSRWRPLLQQLGQRAGICFDLVVPASIPTFEQGLQQGSYAYAFMNPYHQWMVQQRYQPLVRDGKTLLKGILLVRNDSPIKALPQLAGATIAFPSPNAFAASLLIRAHLHALAIPFKPDYLKTHSNVYRAVAIQQLAAGGGVNNTLRREPQELRDMLRVLYTTPGYPAHPFSARRDLPAAETDRLVKAWLSLAADPKAAPLLNAVQLPQPVASDHQRDYQPLQQLQLQQLVDPADPSG